MGDDSLSGRSQRWRWGGGGGLGWGKRGKIYGVPYGSPKSDAGGQRVRGCAEIKDAVQFLFCLWSLPSGKNDRQKGE